MTDITKNEKEAWSGGEKPFVASYGKLMMWFFLVSDALTFSGFLAAYGFMRFKYSHLWPVAEDVFTHFPFLKGRPPFIVRCTYDVHTYYEFGNNGISGKCRKQKR
jgi:cytochrome c oxidase subunit 3